MILLNAAMAGVLVAAAATEKPAVVVEGADSPVKIDKATVLTVEGAPPLIFYSATNQTENDLEQFTVMVFIFDPTGFLKIEQIAPGRRLLEAKSTKYSTIVLDVAPVDPNATIVIGVNQAQRLNSDNWWKADIKAAAEAAVPRKKP